MSGRPGEPPLDPWSVVHVLGGAAVGLLTGSVLVAIAAIVGYEVLEAGLRRVKRHGKGIFEHESWPNIFHDILFGMVGWLFAQGAPRLDVTAFLPW